LPDDSAIPCGNESIETESASNISEGSFDQYGWRAKSSTLVDKLWRNPLPWEAGDILAALFGGPDLYVIRKTDRLLQLRLQSKWTSEFYENERTRETSSFEWEGKQYSYLNGWKSKPKKPYQGAIYQLVGALDEKFTHTTGVECLRRFRHVETDFMFC
jgi:hypothetical protein